MIDDPLVRAEQHHAFDQGLGDQHAVEPVPVDLWQRLDHSFTCKAL